MKVRYNRRLGAFLVGVSSLFIAGNILVSHVNYLSLFLSLVMPIGWLILGLINLTQPYVIIDEHALVVHPFLGPLKDQYTFRSLQDVSIEHNQLWIRQQQQWKRLPLPGWLVHKQDRQALITFVQQEH